MANPAESKSGGMDDILSSIRRIISESEERTRARVASQSQPAATLDPANDRRTDMAAKPTPGPVESDEAVDDDGGLRSVLDRLDADIASARTAEPEPVQPARRMLSAQDREAFLHVGEVLGGDHQGVHVGAKRDMLVSSATSQAITASFEALEKAFERSSGDSLADATERVLRPMLQDWLDNNLPQMVERLVKAEIERVARGEPR